MKKRLASAVAASFVCCSSMTVAQNVTVAELQVMLPAYLKMVSHDPSVTQSEVIAGAAGIGYVEGVMDASPEGACLPAMTQREVALNVYWFLKGAHGSMDKKPGSYGVVRFMRLMHPCDPKPTGGM